MKRGLSNAARISLQWPAVAMQYASRRLSSAPPGTRINRAVCGQKIIVYWRSSGVGDGYAGGAFGREDTL